MKKLIVMMGILSQVAVAQPLYISTVSIQGNTQVSNIASSSGPDSVAVAGTVAIINSENSNKHNQDNIENVNVTVINGVLATNATSNKSQSCAGVICYMEK